MNNFLKRYYDMLYPESLKENEYVCLFMVKTDEGANLYAMHMGMRLRSIVL